MWDGARRDASPAAGSEFTRRPSRRQAGVARRGPPNFYVLPADGQQPLCQGGVITPWMKRTSSHLAISSAWRVTTASSSARYEYSADATLG